MSPELCLPCLMMKSILCIARKVADALYARIPEDINSASFLLIIAEASCYFNAALNRFRLTLSNEFVVEILGIVTC